MIVDDIFRLHALRNTQTLFVAGIVIGRSNNFLSRFIYFIVSHSRFDCSTTTVY